VELTQRLQSLKRRLTAASQQKTNSLFPHLAAFHKLTNWTMLRELPRQFTLTRAKIHHQWSHGPNVRLYAATFTAAVLFISGSYVAVDRIQSTQSWVEVFSNGTFMGLVPNDKPIVSGLKQTAAAYDVNIELYPVHTHANLGYDWQSVASLPTDAVAIRSNGKPLVYVSSTSAAESVLSQVEKALTPKGISRNAQVQFVGHVDTANAVVSVASILNPTSAVHYLLHPSSAQLAGRSASLVSMADTAQNGQAGWADSIFGTDVGLNLATASDTSAPAQTATLNTGSPSQARTLQLDIPTQRGGLQTGGGVTSVPNGSTVYGGTAGTASSGAASTGSRINTVSESVGSGSATNGPAATVRSAGPLLSVQAKQTVTQVLAMPFPIQYEKTPHLGLGVIKVLKTGKPGTVQERIQITYVNGRPTGKTVLAKTVLVQPHAEVAEKGTNSGMASGSWIWPTDAYDITSGFGWRMLYGGPNFHPGKDIGVPIGSPVYATNNGVVVQAGWNSGGYGNWVMINNGSGIDTVFGHLSHVLVHVGQTVAKGDLIARSGDTGFSTGPHLHYEVRQNGVPIDPTPYM
jgi:hypothetical protein